MRTQCNWKNLRAEYEAGESKKNLSERYKVSREAIRKRAQKEGWKQPEKKARPCGLHANFMPTMRASCQLSPGSLADYTAQFLDEWEWHGKLVDEVRNSRDFNLAKLVKILGETLGIRQNGIRQTLQSGSKDANAAQQKTGVIILPGLAREEE